MFFNDFLQVEEEQSIMGKGKRVRRQVQYFQPGTEEFATVEDDNDYDDAAQHPGSDNEYQGSFCT